MASGLTDHVWSVRELLSYRVAPPRLSWHQNGEDDQASLSRHKASSRLHDRDRCFACERGLYVRPPDNGVLLFTGRFFGGTPW
jgi:hypothetical protein